MLRVLQEKYIQRVGGNEKIPVDVRVLAATHRDLESAMKENQFREDLFYRLSGVTIVLPPLSQRAEDIPDLVKYFMQRSAGEVGVEAPSIQPEALAFLQNQAWRGNVRELENVVRQALLLARNYPIRLEHAQEAYTRTRKSVLVSDQSMAGYFTGLLGGRRPRQDDRRDGARAICSGHSISAGQSSQGHPLARGDPHHHAREVDSFRTPPDRREAGGIIALNRVAADGF